MWPFASRRRPSLVVGNQLDDDPPVKSPLLSATKAVKATTKTVAGVHQLSQLHLQALITEAASLDGKLAGLLPDLDAPHGNLGTFAGDVEAAYQRLKYTVGQSPDIILRRITVGENLKWPALVAFADGMVDNEIVDQDTVRVVELYRTNEQEATNPEALHATVLRQMVAAGHVTTSSQWDKLLTQLTYGNTLVFVQGNAAVLIIDSVKFQARAIERAKSEPSVKGPQEAFNEILLTHMNQVRRRIRSPWLHFDPISVGGYTSTTVLVVHIEGLTNPALVAAIKDRVRNIRRDTVQELTEVTSYLLERRSLFPQVRMTERVDWAVRELTRGKVVLMVDNTPFVATLPVTLMDFYQTTQDYVFSFWDGTLVRLVRCLGVMLSLFLMPLYIALFSVDPDLVPTKLALTVAGSELGIPFPPVMEVLIMWVIIEILREAANRLPTELAVTLGTVGAVVVGTAIVKAGIVDPILIVMVTLTALALFTTPAFELTAAWRWLFWALIVGAYVFGVPGIIMVTVLIIAYLSSLESFGVPYLSPFAPLSFRDLKDSMVRFPTAAFTKRPSYTHAIDVTSAASEVATDPVGLTARQRRVRR